MMTLKRTYSRLVNRRIGRKIGTLAAVATLGGCVELPHSGPSTGAVREVARGNIHLINLDSSVVQRLADATTTQLFSDAFTAGRSSSVIVEAGDVIEVSIWEAPPAVLFSPSMRQTNLGSGALIMGSSNATTFPPQMVNADGTIDVPFAGRINAAEKSLDEIESEISRQLQGKANRPQVLVRRIDNNSAYATVVGDVSKSIRLPLTPHGERLLDALAAASGTKEPVSKITLQLTRGPQVHALPLDTVIRDPRQNVVLQPGDVVTALYQPHYFTALGATGRSQEVNFEAQGISLAQALGRVGGLNDDRASARGVFIFRFESTGAVPGGDRAVTTRDGKVPVIYRLDLRDPRALFYCQDFPMANKDVLYVSNASAADLQKFVNLLLSAVYPVVGAVQIARP